MFDFKTQKGATRFRNVTVAVGLLIFFSKPIWDMFLEPVYNSYVRYQG